MMKENCYQGNYFNKNDVATLERLNFTAQNVTVLL